MFVLELHVHLPCFFIDFFCLFLFLFFLSPSISYKELKEVCWRHVTDRLDQLEFSIFSLYLLIFLSFHPSLSLFPSIFFFLSWILFSFSLSICLWIWKDCVAEMESAPLISTLGSIWLADFPCHSCVWHVLETTIFLTEEFFSTLSLHSSSYCHQCLDSIGFNLCSTT